MFDEKVLSDCCHSDYEPMGFVKEDGSYQDKCLNCGKPCESIWARSEVDLQSSASEMGQYVTQIIIGVTGIKKTYRHVDTTTIEQGQFTKFRTKSGKLVMVNDNNVMFVEVYEEKKDGK